MKIVLPPGPASASAARRAVRQACAGTVAPVDDVLLCVSELVTNALLHGRPPVELETDVNDRCVRIAVSDHGSGIVQRRVAVNPNTSAGRGLHIVHSLASRWGTDPGRSGTTIWFEFDIS